MRVLICGASIAGLATAHWLARGGHDVTLVERAPEVRRGGVAVDVRGEALDVVREMGLYDVIAARAVVGQDVFRFVDTDGSPQAELRVADDFYDSPGDIEISRDVLCDLLAAAVPPEVDVRYDESVSAADDRDDSIMVTLSDGSRVEVDLLVGADGMHSTVRALRFGPERAYLRHLGLYVGILKRCQAAAQVEGSEVFNVPGRMVLVRSDGTAASALLGFRSDWIEYDFRDVAVQRRLVLDAFSDERRWRLPALLDEVAECEDFYFDSVSQIKMPGWHDGHAVLVGDAGYCASFFSGMGTSLALVGARTLAAELARAEDVAEALAAYDFRMRPVVEAAHAVADEGARVLFPLTVEEIEQRNAAVRAGAMGVG